MVFFLYFGRKYSATARGNRVKPVRCDGCGHQFSYVMHREVTCHASSPYMLDNKGASAQAASEAQRSLAWALENECDAVPCPRCKKFQPEMLHLTHDFKRQKRKSDYFIMLLFVAATALILGGIYVASINRWL